MSFVGLNALATNTSGTQNDSFDIKMNSSDIIKAPLRERSNTPQPAGKLTQIMEEEKGTQETSEISSHSITSDSDKENPNIDFDFVQTRFKPLTVEFNSTPQRERNSMEGILTVSKQPPAT